MKILFENAVIITQNETREVIPRGYVLVEDDTIRLVGNGDCSGKFDDVEMIDLKGSIIVPGFINAHVHLGESIYAGFLDGWFDLEEYLRRTNEISKISETVESERRTICDYSILQMIRSGTSAIAGGRTSDSAETFGIRNVSGYMLMRSPKLGRFSRDIGGQFERISQEADKALTQNAIFIHSLGTVDEPILSEARNLKMKYPNLRIMAHVAETSRVEEEAMSRFGLSSVGVLRKYGLLDVRTILIHGNNLTPKDFSLIRDAGASLVHCLSSNLRVADRTLDLRLAQKFDIPVSAATDGSATAGTFSVLSEARRCYAYHNRFVGEEEHIPAQDFLDMITVNPAKLLGLSESVGSVVAGKKADLAFLTSTSSVSEPVDSLLTDDTIAVTGLMVDGKRIFWESRLTNEKEPEIESRFLNVVGRVGAELAATRSRHE